MFRHIPGKWISTGTRDMKEAIRFAEERMRTFTPAKRKGLTMKAFSQGFFTEDPYGYRKRNDKRNHKYKEAFYTQHQGRLDNYIIPKFGDYLVSSITDVMIEDWFLDLKSHKFPDRELSDDAKNKVLLCFRIVMDEAKRQGLISHNPAKDVVMINEENEKREPFNLAELRKMFPTDKKELLRIWGSRMWAVYFLIMRDTGFRPGEVSALEKDSYIPNFKGIYTESSVDFRTRKVQQSIKTTSKGQPYKVGILTQQTRTQLEKLIQATRGEYLFMIGDRHIEPCTSNKHLRASCQRAGVEIGERTQYCLRHSFETNLSGKIDNKQLLELMAHTSYRGEYDHRTPEMILEQLQSVAEVIEDLA
jgi:integrase